ncbi:MAG TPA: hypothetical protein PLP98_13440, partial [Plasticicumulans sp.]|nr:hypothetical protein [Plasticicumulans sp.]
MHQRAPDARARMPERHLLRVLAGRDVEVHRVAHEAGRERGFCAALVEAAAEGEVHARITPPAA